MMPQQGRALVVRPDYEEAVYVSSQALKHFIDYARSRGFTVTDLSGDMAVRDFFLREVSRLDPVLCVLLGHGTPNLLTGQNHTGLVWVCDCRELSGRIVFALSCNTAKMLGPDCVAKGCRTYVGYDEPFMWVQEQPLRDPMEDRVARSFFEPVLEFLRKLADGYTVEEAYRASIDKWNMEIIRWVLTPDPISPLVLMWLLHDRDHQKLIGDPSARATSPPTIPWIPLSYLMGMLPVAAVSGIVASSEISKTTK